MNDVSAAAVTAEEQALFYFTGKRHGGAPRARGESTFRPALFGRFHDLTRLRYDYPLVLLDQADEHRYVRSLSELVDDALAAIAPAGLAGDKVRRHVLRAERELRVLLREGASGSLRALWDQATARLEVRGADGVREDLVRARAALGADGRLLDCDRAMPAQLAAQAWRVVQDRKAQAMRSEIDALIVRLADLIRADHMRSGAGRSAELLAAGVGGGHRDLFDFATMARLLAKPSGASALSASRRGRIEAALAVLSRQKFFLPGAGHGFEFSDAAEAVETYRRRLPELAELVRAITIGDLEVHGRYIEAKHDPWFDGWSAESLSADDLARFPDYLVWRGATAGAATDGALDRARLLDALSSRAPIKVVVDSGALLDDASTGLRNQSLGAQFAATAMGIDDVYVLQAAASHLYRARDQLMGAMRYAGPALINVYAGARIGAGGTDARSPYLLAAAAMEARLFPAFCYDPGAGPGLAARFTLEGNPQPASDWPQHELCWADAKQQRQAASLSFTLADFALCDPGCAHHFAPAPKGETNAELIDVATAVAAPRAPNELPLKLPFVYAIDDANVLSKLVVDDKLVQATRECLQSWRRLCELDALKHAGQSSAPATTAAATDAPSPGTEQAGTAAVSSASVPAPAAKAEAPAEARTPGQPYIETERCSSCNECINLNGAMFAYNANQQAYIANPDAGTYKELVEAAESCQVAVIHPGLPRNPKESGLEELVQRAEAYQ